MDFFFIFVVLVIGECVRRHLNNKISAQSKDIAGMRIEIMQLKREMIVFARDGMAGPAAVTVAPQSLTRSVSKVMPIDSLDEKALGQEMKRRTARPSTTEAGIKTEVYLNQLMHTLEAFKHKPFDYSVVLMTADQPNAMALPGGTIMVTTSLLKTLKSESEVMAVLAHEMGHVELSHCFESVKYEMLSKKIMHSNIGVIADFAQRFLVQHSYSKTQEDEADEYAFKTLTMSRYDPSAEYRAFERLLGASFHQSSASVNPLRDYFQSHPPLDQRIRKFGSEAELWWHSHPDEKRYLGIVNLERQVNFPALVGGASEWAVAHP